MKAAYWVLAAAVAYFVIAPVAGVVLYATLPPSPPAVYASLFFRALPYLRNSLALASFVAAASTAIGLCAALALRRFAFRGRPILRLAFALPLANPPFVGSLAFIMLFGRRGLISHGLLGLDASPFGWQGVAALQILGFGSLAYLVAASGVDRIDAAQEDAARTLGASEFAVFRDVALPSLKPELSTAAVLVFLGSMSDFGTPLIIGGSFRTLAADLYIQITGLYDMRSAAVSGLLLLLPCGAAFLYQRRRLVPGAYYASGARASGGGRFYHRGLRALFIAVAALYSAAVLVQFAFIAVGAFTERWGRDYAPTLKHFAAALSGDLSPFVNSVSLAFVSAFFASFLGVLLAYQVKRRRFPFSAAVDLAATVPAAVPGILFGIGYLVVFKYPLFGIGRLLPRDFPAPVLLGTGAIVYLLCVFRYLHVGLRSGSALLEHADPDLEDAARNLGRSDGGVFLDIVLPLLAPAFFAAFLKTFSAGMITLGAIIFLILPSNKVAVQQLFQIITGSGVGAAAALGLSLSALALGLSAAFRGTVFLFARRLR